MISAMIIRHLLSVSAICLTLFCQAQWTGLHIGDQSSVSGNFNVSGSQIIINSSGMDVWDASDDFYFVYQAVCGDFTIVTKLNELQNSGAWAKSGLMVREQLVASSSYAMVATFQPDNPTGTCFQYRIAQNATSQSSNCNANAKTNMWYKLTRTGNTIQAFVSTHGHQWEILESRVIDMANFVYVGIASTSFDPGQLGYAVYSNISLQTNPAASRIFMEAESATFDCCYVLSSSDYFASGLHYLRVKDGYQNTATPSQGLLHYPFNTCIAASYRLWVRVKAENQQTNKLWFRINGLPWEESLEFDPSDEWTWQYLSTNPAELLSGHNSITLAYYSDSLSIDRILITDSLAFVPEGFGNGPIFGPEIYLSNDGNDNNTGTSPDDAWKSIEKLNVALGGLMPGSIIYFRSGDVYEGEVVLRSSGAPGSPVTFTSYGEGENPNLSGALTLTNWQNHGGNIYRVYWPHDAPVQVFVDDELVIHARYPTIHEGFLFKNGALGNSGFVAEEFPFSVDVVEGAVVRFRSNDWTWENRIVASFENNSILFDSPSQYETRHNFGYYLDGKPDFLDTPNEWALDAQKDSLYLWFPEGKTPENALVKASFFQNGISFGSDEKHIVIENLHFDKQAKHAVDVSGTASKNIVIRNNEFTGINKTAVNLRGKNLDVLSNQFSDLINTAIYGHNLDGVNISHNIIRRVGLNYGYGQTGQHNTCGIYLLDSENALIAFNRLDSIGYGGILAYCTNSIIKKNVVTYAGLTLNDVGAFYCWGHNCNNSVWRNNIGLFTYGNRIATGGVNEDQPSSMGFALYFDNNSSYLIAEDNTFAFNSSGMHSNAGSNNNWFLGNISYKNNSNQLLYSNFAWLGDGPIHGMKAEDNVLFASSIYNRVFNLKGTDIYSMGTVDKNYYMNPWDHEGLMTSNIQWSTWVENMNDHNSKLSFYVLEQASDDDPSELLINDTGNTITVELSGSYVDIDNNPVSSVELAPFSSKVVIKDIGFTLRSTTDISGVDHPGVILYPNPVTKYLYLENLPDNVSLIECIDSHGRVLQLTDGKNFSGKIDTSGLPSGVFILRIYTPTEIMILKFMKG